MPYLQLINRRRKLVRARPRPTANGNFITFKTGGMVFALIFTPLKTAYVFYKTYTPPQSMPIGYTNQPRPKVLPKYLGTVTRPQDLIPADLTIPDTSFVPANVVISPPTPIATPVPIPQPVIPTATTASQIAGFDNGNSFQLVLTTSPQRIYQNSVPCKTVLIIADSTNVGLIYVGFSPSVSNKTGTKIPKGAGISIPISDAGKIYIVADNANDAVSGFYMV